MKKICDNQITDHLDGYLRERLGDKINSQLFLQLYRQIGNGLIINLRNRLRIPLEESVKEKLNKGEIK